MNPKPRIVILDSFTTNPGDMSWGPLDALGDLILHNRTKPEKVFERASGASILLTNKAVVSGEVIRQLRDLRYIGILATGYNVVDVAVATERKIPVCNIPGYSTASAAQMTFALLLELTSHVGHHSDAVRAGRWASCEDFCFWDHTLIELAGLNFGIVGFGNIGRQVARIAHAFGMKVLLHSRRGKVSDEYECVGLEELFERADVVSLHCPLDETNKGFVNAALLARMKSTAFLLNTGRGPLINEADLAAALNRGQIAGAGLDVLSTEPPPADNPLLQAKNAIITPHIAWASKAARARLIQIAADNVRGFLENKPTNVVNPDALG